MTKYKTIKLFSIVAAKKVKEIIIADMLTNGVLCLGYKIIAWIQTFAEIN